MPVSEPSHRASRPRVRAMCCSGRHASCLATQAWRSPANLPSQPPPPPASSSQRPVLLCHLGRQLPAHSAQFQRQRQRPFLFLWLSVPSGCIRVIDSCCLLFCVLGGCLLSPGDTLQARTSSPRTRPGSWAHPVLPSHSTHVWRCQSCPQRGPHFAVHPG